MSETQASGEKAASSETEEPGRMSIFEHLDELRRRLIKCFVVVGVTTVVCIGLAENLYHYLRGPLDKMLELGKLCATGDAPVGADCSATLQLQAIAPLESFLIYLKLSVLAGVFISAPWVLLQLWLFISPGLYGHEKRWVIPFVFFGTLFFVGGAAFGYEMVLPMGFKYLLGMTPEGVLNNWSVGQYFSVVIRLLLAFGVVFEVPLLMWILAAAGIVAPKSFSRFRKYWLVIAWVVAAFLTPADPFTQAAMAIPMMAFFEIGQLGARILYRRREKKLAEEQA